jgi:hypothetical protein
MILTTLVDAIDLSTATNNSSGARRIMNEFKQSATLDHLVGTIV